MPTVQKRITSEGKVRYRVIVRINGFPARTATFIKRSDAVRWGQDKELEFRQRKFFPHSPTPHANLSYLLDRYISEVIPLKKDQGQTRQLLWWKKRLGHLKVSEVSPSLISQCKDELLKGKTYKGTQRSPATVNRYLAVLSHAFTIAWKEWQVIDHNPVAQIRKLKETRGRVRFLNDDERRRLLEICKTSRNTFLYTIVVLALSTGMRKGEILGLRWRDVDIHKTRITIGDTKNDERRTVPLIRLSLQLIKDLMKRTDPSPNNYLFHVAGDVNSKCCIRTAWNTAIRRANIENFRFHDLRHSTASYLAMNGASLLEIADILGHKTLQMVMRYSHLSDDHKASVLEKMNKKVFG